MPRCTEGKGRCGTTHEMKLRNALTPSPLYSLRNRFKKVSRIDGSGGGRSRIKCVKSCQPVSCLGWFDRDRCCTLVLSRSTG